LFGTALLRLPNRFVRQQQRDEIMQCFAIFVNPLLTSLAPPLVLVDLPRCGDQNYNKALARPQEKVLRLRHLTP
jgi:hypothetical protein